jgi:hypothetical protein
MLMSKHQKKEQYLVSRNHFYNIQLLFLNFQLFNSGKTFSGYCRKRIEEKRF